MTENRARIVQEPTGYDYPATDRIPAQGDFPDGQTTVGWSEEETQDGTASTSDGQPHNAGLSADEAYAPTPPADDAHDDNLDDTHEDTYGNRDDTHDGVATMPEPEPVDRIERDEPVAEPAGNHAAGSVEASGGEGFFPEDTVTGFRDRWRELQSGFVDDPQQAVRGADELVSEIMRELADRKQSIEEHWRAGANDTEELRVAIQEYRSFLNQLLNA
ncbi:hypothetical protein [Actinophytocola sp.]|uniref:hypothetical protein n=1 Tax=Actinophytocola sp. TaxID=1872138 RepID=UPI00389A25C7